MKISFWSQGLDNQHDEFAEYDLRTKGLSFDMNNDTKIRIVQRISAIKQAGTAVHQAGDKTTTQSTIPELYVHHRDLLLKVIPQEADVEGRLAPIVCLIEDTKYPDLDPQGMIIPVLKDYCQEIGRTLDEDIYDVAGRLMDGAKKNNASQRRFYCFGVLAVVFFASALGLWVFLWW